MWPVFTGPPSLDQGIVLLLAQHGIYNGFWIQLPPNFPYPSWTWTAIHEEAEAALQSPNGFFRRRFEIACYGNTNGTGADVINLANAINNVLNGFVGYLPDPHNIFVGVCWNIDETDSFDSSARSKERRLEYEILWANTQSQ